MLSPSPSLSFPRILFSSFPTKKTPAQNYELGASFFSFYHLPCLHSFRFLLSFFCSFVAFSYFAFALVLLLLYLFRLLFCFFFYILPFFDSGLVDLSFPIFKFLLQRFLYFLYFGFYGPSNIFICFAFFAFHIAMKFHCFYIFCNFCPCCFHVTFPRSPFVRKVKHPLLVQILFSQFVAVLPPS